LESRRAALGALENKRNRGRPEPRQRGRNLEVALSNSSGRQAVLRVKVVRTHPNFGGVRLWYECPRCGRRAGKLYAIDVEVLGCRVCLGLAYKCQYRKDLLWVHLFASLAFSPCVPLITILQSTLETARLAGRGERQDIRPVCRARTISGNPLFGRWRCPKKGKRQPLRLLRRPFLIIFAST